MTRLCLPVEQLHSRARSLTAQFDQGGRTTRGYIDEAITLDRKAVKLCPLGHRMRPSSLTSLSVHLFTRYCRFGETADLEEAIVLGREALKLRPQGHPDRSIFLNNIADRLFARYNKFGVVVDLDEAIVLDREALELRPQGHPDRSFSLNHLAVRLSTRYNKFGSIADLDEAILLTREALELRPQGHPSRSFSLNSLTDRLSTRYNNFGAIADLNEAIVLAREALELRPQGHPDRPSSLNSLSDRLSTRYDNFGAVADLNEAIAFDREALDLRPQGHPDRSFSLNHLTVHLSTRYSKFGAVADLNEAIVAAREALELRPHGHTSRSFTLNSLANRLSTRYNKFGDIPDLNEAIALAREALQLCPRGHPDRPGSLNSLADRFSTRYNNFGAAADLDEAIVLDREALELRPQGHPSRSFSLNHLVVRLSTRYNKFGATADLNEAIDLAREALELRPQGHPSRSFSLNSLADCLSTRYSKSGAIIDLNESIVLAREALELRPMGHPDRPTSLNSLADRLSTRHNKFGAVTDLDEAIVLDREALELRPQGHPDRSFALNHLTVRLSTRYGKFGATADLDEAIVLARDALKLRPQGHPGRSNVLNNLATCLSTRCNQLSTSHNPNLTLCNPSTLLRDQEELFSLYSQLADVSHTVSSNDLDASRAWIRAAEKFMHPSILLAYETSLRLLVEHLSLLPSLPQHLVILKRHTSSLAVDAFSACLRNGTQKRAVELLEQGRSVFWNQLTRLHSSLDDVIAAGPEGKILANKLTNLTAIIFKALHSPGENQHDQLCHLNLEVQSVVSAIRELPGLSRFLLPLLFPELQCATHEGPVIIVNASQYSCDVLIIIDNRDPVHIPLSITKQYVRILSSKLRTLPRRAISRNERIALGGILRELWDDVVFHVVRFLQTIHPLRSRIWWCPTGEFSDLPLHAAGPYRKGQSNLPDLYISSYTPTLSALIRARRTHISRSGSCAKRFVAIGQANAVGQNKLLSVDSELARIGRDVSGAAIFRQIMGEDSRIPRVAEELGKNEWVHFACHGLANRKEPFKSAFALNDGHFTIERIIRCDLDDPEFVYLSACQTTVGDEESPDEAIHLASAMQFIGFRSVIGTMWSVDDDETNVITSMFYKHMLDESGRLDYTRAALALNETMRALAKRLTIDQQILYIHLGA